MGAILDAALEYAEAGYAVIPVRRSDKSPYPANGSHDATKDPNTIRTWWRWWPDANVAIVCGHVSGYLFALDVDVKDGKHGDREILKWQAEHGDFPNTVRQITGSGGIHYFFRSEDIAEYKNTVDALPGVDVRGEYAYVVVAPSVYSDGRTYSWDRGISVLDVDEIAEANDSAMELLALNPQKGKKTNPDHKKLQVRDIQEGGRNDSIFRYAALQRGADVPYDIALTSAEALNDTWSNPLPDSEVRKAVDSAYKYEPNEATIYGEPPEAEPAQEDLVVHTLDEFKEREIEWLIPQYVPKGQITIIAGTGGVGKTSVWVSLVADLSSGKATLFEKSSDTSQYVKRKPMKVMFFSGEDTVEHVLRKKLRQQGAILKNITTISLEEKRFSKLLFGSKYLEAVIAEVRPDVVLFDPLQAFIGEKAKMADRNDIRQRMRCLIEFGSKYGTTSIIIMHTNKLQNAWGRNRMADSADLWDIARSVIMCGDTETDGVKYLSHEKCNYAKTGDTILFKNDGGNATYYMKSGLKDRDFVFAASKARRQKNDSPDVEDAEEMVMSALMEYPDGLLTKELEALLEEGGLKPWSIRQAKANLKARKKIKYIKSGNSDPWRIKKV